MSLSVSNMQGTTWTVSVGGVPSVAGVDYNVLYGVVGTYSTGGAPNSTGNRSVTIEFLKPATYKITAVIKNSNGSNSTVSKNIVALACPMTICKGQNTTMAGFTEDFGQTTTRIKLDPARGSIQYTDSLSQPLPDEYYSISNQLQLRPEWDTSRDHTGNSNGAMLVANSSFQPKLFYSRQVNGLCTGAVYNFSAWFRNADGKGVMEGACAGGMIYAGVTFEIVNAANNAILQTFNTYDVSAPLQANPINRGWQQYGGSFKTPPGVSNVIVQIRNNNPGGCGNDIAIDDISFAYCAPYIYSFFDGQTDQLGGEYTMCAGAATNLTSVYAPADYFTNPQYFWQYSDDNVTWTTISGDGDGLTGSATGTLHFAEDALLLQGSPTVITQRWFRLMIYENGNTTSCAQPSVPIKVILLPNPKISVAGAQICIGSSATLTACCGYDSYTWDDPAATESDNLTVAPTTTTVYTVTGRKDYGSGRTCYRTADAPVIVDDMPVPNLTMSTPATICLGQAVDMSIDPVNAGYDILWTPNGETTTSIHDVPTTPGSKAYGVTVTNGTCSVSDSRTVTVRDLPDLTIGSIPASCRTSGTFTIPYTGATNNPNRYDVVTAAGNPMPGFVAVMNQVLPASPITVTYPVGTAPGTYTFNLVLHNTTLSCDRTKPFSVVVQAPSTPPTGILADKTQLCVSGTVTLTVQGGSLGTGAVWRWYAGACGGALLGTGPSITTGTISSTTTFYVRAESAGPCGNSTCASATVTVLPQPAAAAAGPDQDHCEVPTFLMGATAATPASATGTWSVISASVPVANIVIASPTNQSSNVTVPNGATATLAWTVSNGVCPPSSDQVVLTNYSKPTVANAGTNQKLCNVTSFTMAANTATIGTGTWSRVYGTAGTITNPNSPTTTVTGITPGDSIILRWTIANGPCTPSTSDVTLVSYKTPTTANAGLDQKLCNVTSFTLAANTPAAGAGNGYWTTIYGGKAPANLTSPTSTITVVPGDSIVLRWTIANGTCPPSTDDVILVSYKTPTTANAGLDQKLCNVTSFTLAANTPAAGAGNGYWTTIYGGKAPANLTSPTSTITVVPGDSIVLRWTIANGTCPPSTDDVILVSYKTPTTANAGLDQKLCNVTSFTLAANTPAAGAGYGYWTTIYGGKAPANLTSPTSTITVVPGDSIILRWTIANGACPSSIDDVTLVSYKTPTTAAAGLDQKLCNVTSFTLAANTPAAGAGYGYWTTIYGGKAPANLTSPTSTITVVPGDSIVLRWTIANGNCPPSTDDVTLVSYKTPTVAAAGLDQKLCNVTSFTLAANTPAAGAGYGYWTTIYGGKAPANLTSPTSTITVAPGDSIVLRWTIANGVCPASTDDVTLVSYRTPTVADAGLDQKLCNVTSFTLAANTPAAGAGYGYWTTIYGGKAPANLTSPTSTITVVPGDSIVLRWTIANGNCPPSTNDVTLVSYKTPTTANAGLDQKLCNVTSFTLAANTPAAGAGYGYWTTIYGGKAPANLTSPTSTITVVPGDSIVLRWTIANGTCPSSTDDVILVSYRTPTVADAGPDQKLCNVTSFTLAANTPAAGAGYGYWTTIYGGKAPANLTSPTSTITVAPGDSIILRWTIANGTCPSSTSDVTLVSYRTPTVADAGLDQKLCNVTSFTLAANTPAAGAGYGYWTTIYGGKAPANLTSPTSTITVVPGDSIILRWTIANGNCPPSTSDVTLVSYRTPTVAAAGPSQKLCNVTSFTLAANTPTIGYGYWSTVYGGKAPANLTSPTSTITVAPGDSIILRWNIANGTCPPSTSDVTLVSYETPTVADAGLDQKACNVTSFTLAANTPTIGYGYWSTVYGGKAPANLTDPNSTITVAPGDSIVLRWNIANGTCPPSTNDVTLVSYRTPTVAAAGLDQKACNVTSFTLAANTPAAGAGYGYWTTIYGGKAPANLTSPTSTITVAPGDSIILRWTIANGNCPPSTSDVTLVSYRTPTVAAAGPNQKDCNVTSFTLAANTPTIGYGYWSTVYGGKAPANLTNPTSTITVAPGDSIILRWNIANGNCPPSTSDVTLVSYLMPTTADAGPDQKLCYTTSFTMAANTPAVNAGTGRWSVVYGTANIATPTSPTSGVTIAQGDSVILRWTITNGNCAVSTDDVTLISYESATIAAAGPDQKLCNVTSFTLAANNPAIGSGAWSIVYGTPVIANLLSPTSTVTVAPGDSVVLRWTISNGLLCPSNSDDVILVSYEQPTVAAAGPDQKLCNVTSFTLAANTPSIGTGKWSILYGTPVIASLTSATSTVTVAPGDSVVLRWTISNGTCPPSTDDVTLVSYKTPTVAAAGPDQKLCNVTSFTLAANTPAAGAGYGYWTTIYGGKAPANLTSPTSTIAVVPGDSIILRWTIANGTCPPSTSDVTLVSYITPTVAAAGPDQKDCNVTSFTLAANTPAAGAGHGYWTTIYGGKAPANLTDPASTITVAPGDSIILRWTIANGTCPPSTDDITLVSYRTPTTAAAGPDQKLCNVTSFTLAANAPAAGAGYGYWTTIYGGKAPANLTSPTSTITVVPGDSIILRWTIANGNCPPSTSDVTLVSYKTPTVAAAGPDQKLCNVTSFTLAANTPAAGAGYGYWTTIYGGKAPANLTSPTSTITVAPGDSIILRWTIANGTCPPSTDDITLVSYRTPTVAAAGPDQKLCNVTSFTLAANTPAAGAGNGYWTTIYGGKAPANLTSPTSTITVAPGDSIILRWTIANGTCPPSTDDVTLVSYKTPTVAAAGPDQKLCNVTSFTLAANTPAAGAGYGYWTTIYGGKAPANLTSPTSTITVAPGDSIILRWTIANGVCPPSTDDITLVSYRTPTVAAAGPDQKLCNVTSFTLAANTPAAGAGNGYWTTIYGGKAPANLTSPTSTITVVPGDSIILRWTIANGTCPPSTDDITLVSYRMPTVAAAGPDQKLCNVTSFTLAGNTPTVGTGRWSVVYGAATINAPTSPASTVTVAAGDSVVLRWTISNGTCVPSTDDVILVNYRMPTVAAAGPDQKLCNVTSFTLAGNTPTVGTGRWTVVYGTPTITTPTSPTSTVTVAPGDSVILRWTITNGTCAASMDDVTLVSYAQPTIAAAGADQKLCNVTSFTLAGNTPTVGKGVWTKIYGNPVIANPNSPTSTITVAAGDSVILRWTISNGNCPPSSDDVTLVSYKTAAPALAGPDQKMCNVTSFTLAANTPSVPTAKGTWSIIYGTPVIANLTSPTTTVTVVPGDSVILRWTITNGTCPATNDDVVLVSYRQPTIAAAGADQKMCNVTSFTLAGNTPVVGTGRWTVVYGTATITAPTSPTSTVTVAAGDSVILRWTISNGVCPSTSDDVVLVNYRTPAMANAGPDQDMCNNTTSFTMRANAPGVTGAVGTWTIVSGTATIADIHNPTTTVTVAVGSTVTLRWTITNGTCAMSNDDVVIANRSLITNNTISADQTVCLTEIPAALTGTTPTGGNGTYTYQWQSSTTSATAGFVSIPGATAATYAPGLLTQDTWYRRVVTSGFCASVTSNAVKITVINKPPVVTFVPGPMTVDCRMGMDYTTLFGTPQFSHTPYTNMPLTVTFTDANSVNGCTQTFTRTWTATDRCGMTTTASQTITVVDRTAPVFTSQKPADITVECDKIPAAVNLNAIDDCFGNMSVTPVETRQDIPGACANNYKLIRTWTAVDGCNNRTTLTQTITVQDKTPPVFTGAAPRDTIVNCNAVPPAAPLTAVDNCTPGVITVTATDVRKNIPGAKCTDNYQIVRTWIAMDECGNKATLVQNITVQDTTRPVFSMPQPANVTVDCDKVPSWPAITATDNCTANVPVMTSEQKFATQPACAGNYRLVRTWKATDNCGNTATMTQTITVQDTTRPVFTVRPPADTTVNCDAVPAPPNNVVATDACGTVKLSRTQVRENIPGACASNYRLIRTWIAIDQCGNQAVWRQVITVQDTTRPVIAAPPADVVLNCGDAIPAAPVLTATDNCDPAFPKQATMTEDPYVKDVCSGYTIIRRWRVADACGNQAMEVIQRIVVNACPKPVLDPALPVNCSDNPTFTIKTLNTVTNPTYILVGVVPANAVQVPLSQQNGTFNLNNATQASFIVRDGVTGCISDTVVYNLQYNTSPMVNLGSDTTICGGNSLILDAGAANFAYTIRWSTGETTQRINITNAGKYWVSVTNGICTTTDTIQVTVIPMPLVDIPDASICRGQSVKLDAFVDGGTYLWSNGATTSSILVSTQEQFWVQVVKSGCITIDTVNVTVNPPPDITLNRDTTICPNQSVMLTVNLNNGGNIRWVTGATTNSIVVNEPGQYWVTVSRDNCMIKDTVNVRLQPSIKVELGPNQEICPGSQITIDGTTQDAISYLWDDGDPNPVKNLFETGKYRLGVMDRFCNRVFYDSVYLRVADMPRIDLGLDTVMCNGETLRLRAEGANIKSVLWSDGSTGPYLDVKTAGTYAVTVFNDCGSATDQITVDYTQCDPKPTFPNAFSPNGDGKNDFFRPVVRGPMYEYELRIFNRWGELIYLGYDSKKGWDGRYQGQPVTIGTYVWWLTYKKMPNGNPNIIKGEVTVIR